MAVVPWHVRGVEPSHSLGLNDEVLEALVQGVTKMDGAVGVGWPIVKQVGRPATGGLAQLAIEPHRGPAGEPKGFILGQIGLHGKGGLRQGKGRL